MGIVKQSYFEVLDRGYSSDIETTVCPDCFEDYGVRGMIELNLTASSCSYCGKASHEAIACPLSEVIEHMAGCISVEYGNPVDEGLPYETREGGWQGIVLDTWEFFDEIGFGVNSTGLFDDICESFFDSEWCERNPYLGNDAQVLISGWQRFSNFVINKCRYVFFQAQDTGYIEDQPDDMNPVDILPVLGETVKQFQLTRIIDTEVDLKRVRVVNKGDNPKTARELGTAPPEYATVANRMSPAGISMFYGAFDIETAVR